MYKKEFQHLYDVKRVRIPEPENVVMRLQRLEKPNNWPEALLEDIYGSIPDDLLNRYPDNYGFYTKLSEFLGVPADNLVVTSGIDETIKSLINLSCYPGDKIAVSWPGYAMYDVYAHIFNVELCPIIYDPYSFMSAEELLERVRPDVKILFLPNPSQPVENCFSIEELERISAWCAERNIIFAVDEAYHFFGGPDALPLISDFDNVIVMRTFSKAFGAASLRLGYVAAAYKVIAPLNAFRFAHEANGMSLHVASVLLEKFEKFVMPSLSQICAGRDFLRDKVKRELGLNAWGEASNCVLIDLVTGEKMATVTEALKSRGIYVKGHFPDPLDHYILVTCGQLNLMEAFYENLKNVIEVNN